MEVKQDRSDISSGTVRRSDPRTRADRDASDPGDPQRILGGEAQRHALRHTGPRSARLLARLVNDHLLPELRVESASPDDPVVVRSVPAPWRVLGRGNFAAVLSHPGFPELVVKVYAPGRPGFDAEREVYRRLGEHPAYSQCFHAEDGFLVLKRLHGVTLYDAVHQGMPIPEQVIRDIDEALGYARARGLHPHDVHGRNVMVHEGRGLVVDVSDFLKEEDCTKWEDLKKAYARVYRPLFMPLRLRVPYVVLDMVRLGYRTFRRLVPDRSPSCGTIPIDPDTGSARDRRPGSP